MRQQRGLSDLGSLRERCHELELVAEIARDQEVLPNMFASRGGHTLPERRIAQQVEAPCRAFFRARHEIPGDAVLDLDDDAADLPGHHRNALPERFSDHKTESLAEG